MESQIKNTYRPPVYVTGVMGGLQSMSPPPGFTASQLLALSPLQAPGRLSKQRVPSPKRELTSNLP